ncbi:MAG TPA: sulfatase-like hydrolase/transferase, partial [Flavisolibacter sp.]|nr:sulfatase-like hydrolase/transferase [Flavisolibacter sp.]
MFNFSRLVKWIASVVFLFLIVLTLFRFIIYFSYKPAAYNFPVSAFLMGLRVDIRSVCILGLFMLLLSCFPLLNPFKNNKARKFWNIFLSLLFFITALFCITDYFHFDYLHQRLNASVLNYLHDAGISMNMVWQTYPVLRLALILVVLVVLMGFVFSRILNHYLRKASDRRKYSWILTSLFVIILMAGTWGTLGQFPLRWSTVYTLGDSFKSQIALNPFQSFISTLSFKNITYDLKKVKEDYPLMAEYLGVKEPDSVHLNFARTSIPAKDTSSAKPNVVLVICESFSAYKSSMWGNPLNTTPFFDTLCRNGVFFDRCFTPSYGTARGVWATITGLPDVEYPSTASRNPNIVDQNTIINSFGNYD